MLDVERLLWGMLKQPERWEWDNENAWFDRPNNSAAFSNQKPARVVLHIKDGWWGLRIRAVNGQPTYYDLDLVGRYFLWRKFNAMRTQSVKIAILAGPMMAGKTANEHKEPDASFTQMALKAQQLNALAQKIIGPGNTV